MDVADREVAPLDLRRERGACPIPPIAPNRYAHVLDSPAMLFRAIWWILSGLIAGAIFPMWLFPPYFVVKATAGMPVSAFWYWVGLCVWTGLIIGTFILASEVVGKTSWWQERSRRKRLESFRRWHAK